MKFPLPGFAIVLALLCSCSQKQQVDLIVLNSRVYTVNEDFDEVQAFAVSDGKFIAVGTSKEINRNYKASDNINFEGKTILPGLIDAHCHFNDLGLSLQNLDLRGTQSFNEIIDMLTSFQEERKSKFIIGRGWDQNDWEVKDFPNKEKLDLLFPETPIVLRRIDGHALLVNQAALDLGGINEETDVVGGEIIKKDGELTGILIDNAQQMINAIIPKKTRTDHINALKDAQHKCLSVGLTTVDDAGLSKDNINLIDSLQLAGHIKIRMYAMISASEKNLEYYLDKGIYKSDRLHVRSFKVYADGALGSYGAALIESYEDRENHYGAMVTSLDDLKKFAKTLANSDFQMNTHAIGDSANSYVLDLYANVLRSQENRRWRIEHAQVIAPDDFDYFTDIIPSVQPSHATSDMYWAQRRLGEERIKSAYAYKKLLNRRGLIALGTDFPVEKVNPMLTFFAAVNRMDLEGYPEGGFQIENALSKEETLRGMTIWSAYANFEENEKGSIEVGKLADFIVLDQNIMEIPRRSYNHQGVSIRDYVPPENYREQLDEFKLHVYGRKTDDNGYKIIRIQTSDKRTTHYVPEIQK